MRSGHGESHSVLHLIIALIVCGVCCTLVSQRYLKIAPHHILKWK